ncbi:hypothetical protein EDB85DRAFT_2294098 [Lactarius pseudohatsudake]|nr:hypothetical protein EDB85DRAFT_2294098 [Lactarius pseudohatsudake]
MLETRATSGLKFNLWRGETRKPRHRTPRGSSSSRRHHLNTPDSGAATSTPPPPPRRHLDTLNCPDARAAAPCRRCLNRHPALTATTAATDHHPRQQRHRRINPTRRTPINAAPTPLRHVTAASIATTTLTKYPPIQATATTTTTTHASNVTAASTRPTAPPSTPPPQPQLHTPRHRSNTTARALAPHQPHPAQPPWPDLVPIVLVVLCSFIK